MNNDTERFVDLMEDLLACIARPRLTDVQRARLKDAFNDAVDAREEKALAEARRD